MLVSRHIKYKHDHDEKDMEEEDPGLGMWPCLCVLAGLDINLGFGHQMISWPHYCYQGIVDLLGVF